jgi:hypothetical protein
VQSCPFRRKHDTLQKGRTIYGLTRAILSLSHASESLASWEETIYAGRLGH